MNATEMRSGSKEKKVLDGVSVGQHDDSFYVRSPRDIGKKQVE
jgi:hypothetical protein